MSADQIFAPGGEDAARRASVLDNNKDTPSRASAPDGNDTACRIVAPDDAGAARPISAPSDEDTTCPIFAPGGKNTVCPIPVPGDIIYRIFIPGGNDTALVLGLEPDAARRKTINAAIMRRHPNVEQVGFVSLAPDPPQLMMAGGEFCGNATRAAAWHFCHGTFGQVSIQVSGTTAPLLAGITAQGDAWAEMPADKNLDRIIPLTPGFHLVTLEGIAHVVVAPAQSAAYLCLDGGAAAGLCPEVTDVATHLCSGESRTASYLHLETAKSAARELLTRHGLLAREAAGVMFLESAPEGIRLHPFVHVAALGTLFAETACGSGTMAVGLTECRRLERSVDLAVTQPSGQVIRAVVACLGNTVTSATIRGTIQADPVVYRL